MLNLNNALTEVRDEWQALEKLLFFLFLAHYHKALDSLMSNPASSFRNGFSFLPFPPLAGCLHLIRSLFCLRSSDPQ